MLYWNNVLYGLYGFGMRLLDLGIVGFRVWYGLFLSFMFSLYKILVFEINYVGNIFMMLFIFLLLIDEFIKYVIYNSIGI